MELRHLRYFIALAERLHFTHAAEKVHVTQSTLSHQIKQLEEEIGCTLFERTGKHVSLTAEGVLFLEFVVKAMSNIDDGVRTLKRITDRLSGEIRIGASQSFCAWLVPSCVQSFHASHPDVKLSIEEITMLSLNEKLTDNQIDLAVSYRPENMTGLIFEPLYNEELKLIIPITHSWANRRRVRMVELHNQPLVLLSRSFATRTLLEECFSSAGAEPTVIVDANSNSVMIALSKSLNVATIAPEHQAASTPGLKVISLESPTPMRTFGLLWKRDAVKSIAIQTFAANVRRAAQDANARRPEPS